ncbi:MAG: hypothetical protein RL750_263, partial [Bacteroidota bacterium]
MFSVEKIGKEKTFNLNSQLHLLNLFRDVFLYGQSILEATSQGHFVGVFQFAAEGDAAGDGGESKRLVG